MKPTYLKLWEDWEAPEEWEDPDRGSIETSGIGLSVIDGLMSAWELSRVSGTGDWTNVHIRPLTGGVLTHLICGVSNRIVQLPREWRGKSSDWCLDKRSVSTLSITLKGAGLDQLDSFCVFGAYSQMGSSVGCINVEWTWCGEKGRIDWAWCLSRLREGIGGPDWRGSAASYDDF